MIHTFNYTNCGEDPYACGACDSCTGSPGRLIPVPDPDAIRMPESFYETQFGKTGDDF